MGNIVTRIEKLYLFSFLAGGINFWFSKGTLRSTIAAALFFICWLFPIFFSFFEKLDIDLRQRQITTGFCKRVRPTPWLMRFLIREQKYEDMSIVRLIFQLVHTLGFWSNLLFYSVYFIAALVSGSGELALWDDALVLWAVANLFVIWLPSTIVACSIKGYISKPTQKRIQRKN